MGILRLLLALSVLLTHTGNIFNYNIANSNVAVFSFFVISGFYMSLILDTKYTGHNAIKTFWVNRFLRIFPVYWITLALTLIFVLLKFYLHIGNEDNAIIHYLNYSQNIGSWKFYADLVNVIIRNVTLIFNIDYFRGNNSVPGYLLIPQAWTLQVELLFYLIVPFLIKITKKLFLGVSVLYAIVFFGYIVPRGLIPNTLTYIFLDNLIFFLLGIFSYRFILSSSILKLSKPKFLKLSILMFLGLLLYLVFYNFIKIKLPVTVLHMESFPYYLLLILALPLIFTITKFSAIDSFIGKLSYPVYIMHLLILKLISNLGLTQATNFRSALVIFISLYISYLAIKYIDNPIDKLRQTKARQK